MYEMLSTRTGFGRGLVELAEEREDILVASADTYRSFALGQFVERWPDRYFEFGIAEQNMITACAAMAAEGYTVYAVGYSPFLSMRAVEQIRTFVAYPGLNVKIVSGLSGLSGDSDGVTHQGTEDLSMIRSIPNMTLLSPADAVAAKEMAKSAAEIPGPVYLRLGRGATPVVYPEDTKFPTGDVKCARCYGKKAVIVATGSCVGEAMRAADDLQKEGIGATVLDVYTVKPFNDETIAEACHGADFVLTVEDGSVSGGLGGAVAEALAEKKPVYGSFRRLGLSSFGTAGTYPELLHFFGLDAESISRTVQEQLRK